jgi:hypothetical protein
MRGSVHYPQGSRAYEIDHQVNRLRRLSHPYFNSTRHRNTHAMARCCFVDVRESSISVLLLLHFYYAYPFSFWIELIISHILLFT